MPHPPRQRLNGFLHHEWQAEVLWRLPTIRDQLHCWLSLFSRPGMAVPEEWSTCQLERSEVQVLLHAKSERIDMAPRTCLVIAAVRLPPSMQRQGWFRSFLAHCCNVNPWEAVVIEDVNNKGLARFCARLGFKEFDPFFATTYLVDPKAVQALSAPPFEELERDLHQGNAASEA